MEAAASGMIFRPGWIIWLQIMWLMVGEKRGANFGSETCVCIYICAILHIYLQYNIVSTCLRINLLVDFFVFKFMNKSLDLILIDLEGKTLVD